MKSHSFLVRDHRHREQGFTLIELMVVVLIIAILIAIAIPTFLGARERAQDRQVQVELRNGLTAEKITYTDAQAFEANAATMKTIDPSLDWGGELTFVIGDSSVGTDDMLCLSEVSKSGKTFSLAEVSNGPNSGLYKGVVACPAATEANFAALGTNW